MQQLGWFCVTIGRNDVDGAIYLICMSDMFEGISERYKYNGWSRNASVCMGVL